MSSTALSRMKSHPASRHGGTIGGPTRRRLLWHAVVLAGAPLLTWTAARRWRRTELRGGWIVASDD